MTAPLEPRLVQKDVRRPDSTHRQQEWRIQLKSLQEGATGTGLDLSMRFTEVSRTPQCSSANLLKYLLFQSSGS